MDQTPNLRLGGPDNRSSVLRLALGYGDTLTTIKRIADSIRDTVRRNTDAALRQYRIDVASVLSPLLVDFCEPQPDDVSLQNEIAFCNRRTNLRLYPNLVLPVG